MKKHKQHFKNKLGLILFVVFLFAQFVALTHHHQKNNASINKQTLTEKCSVCEVIQQPINFDLGRITLAKISSYITIIFIHDENYTFSQIKNAKGRSPPKV